MSKPRKHINFFDILIILLVLLVAVAAYLLSHRDGGGEVVTRSCTIELTDLEEHMADAVAVGDTVVDNVKNYEIGTVTAVEVTSNTSTVLDEEEGIFRQAVTEGKITLLVTIQADTVESASSIDTVSGYTLRTGTSVSCTIGKLTASGYILSVER